MARWIKIDHDGINQGTERFDAGRIVHLVESGRDGGGEGKPGFKPMVGWPDGVAAILWLDNHTPHLHKIEVSPRCWPAVREQIGLDTPLDSPDGPLAAPRSSRWPALRAAHLKAHPTCAACGGRKSLAVHHIFPVHAFPERELDAKALLTLCSESERLNGLNCHGLFGHWGGAWSTWNPDAAADAAHYLRGLLAAREFPS